MQKRVLTPRKQLNAFYARQGLSGQALRRAVVADLRLVRRNEAACSWHHWSGLPTYAERCRHSDSKDYDREIAGLFDWARTPQGFSYWGTRDLLNGALV
jgi:hypothetical protein